MDRDIPPGGGGGDHQRARLDLIRDDGIAAAVQLLHPAYADGIGAGALDVGAHAV